MQTPTSPLRGALLVCGTLWLCSPAAQAYKLIGAKWDADKGPVPFHLEPSGSADISDGSDLEAVRQAFRAWSCVEGSSLRFIEGDVDGVKSVDLADGRNSVFWDEDGSFGLGPATLGVNFGAAPQSPDEVVIRDASVIVFNGFDHEWSTDESASATDVASIALHESGHWLGLDHPCDDAQETQCLGPEEAVMTPAYPGGLIREPRADDVAGVREIYPSTDESRCDGPFRQGEVCACNDECITGLLCTEALSGKQVCSPTCSAEDANCPVGFACVFGAAPTDGAPAKGTCVRLAEDDLRPVASLCQRDSDCAAGLCVATSVIGRTVCKKSCTEDTDCPDGSYRCVNDVCVSRGASEGILCPAEPEPSACGCRASTRQAPAPLGVPFGMALAALLMRRRQRPGSGSRAQRKPV